MRAVAREYLPGVALLVVVAAVAHVVGAAIPFVTPLILAIAIGAVIANVGATPTAANRGLGLYSVLLEVAIVLLGASLSVSALLTAGPLLLALVVVTVGAGIAFVTLLSRFAQLNDRLGSLLAAGSSICGVSAIAAIAPAVDADENQIAHAAATILVFDALTLVAFPPIGRLLGLDAQVYGVWIGLAMFSTGPVAAAGFAHSAAAGQWATLTKLVRNALIGVVAVLYSLRYTSLERGERYSTRRLVAQLWDEFPTFLLGFLLVALVVNSGILPADVVSLIRRGSGVLFLLAFAGLGFEIQFGRIRQSGVAPIAVVGLYLVVISAVTYVAVLLLF